MDIQIRNETFRLTPERCLFWPTHRLLAAADLQFGPTLEHDLARLEACATREGAEEIVLLGDFIHASSDVTRKACELFAAWRERFEGRVTVLFGNHDQGLERHWPEAWHEINRAVELEQDGFLFRHEPPTEPRDSFCWAGSPHTVVNLHEGNEPLHVPCFVVEKNFGLLPAFSPLPGGFAVRPHHGTHIYALASGFVAEVKAGPVAGC